jgi:hypothetical protein
VLGGCPAADFGLVGAKIGRSSLARGALETNAAGCLAELANGLCSSPPVAARDYLAAGSYYLDYRVQSFGSSANDDARVRVTIDETINRLDGSWTNRSTATQTFLNLSRREARTGRFAVTVVAGADYTVALQVSPTNGSADTFGSNDTKVFKFRGR